MRRARVMAALGAAVLLLGACTDPSNDPADARDPVCATDVFPCPPSLAVTPATTEWKTIGNMAPPARQEVAATVIDGKLYLAGGLLADGISARAEFYDPSDDTFNLLPDLPEPVHHAMAASFDGRLVVLGGFTVAGATDRVFVLEGDRWREGPRLRRPRGAGAAVTVGDQIVVVGGVGDGHVGPVEIFDGTSWRDGAPIPSLRDHVGAATDGKLVYAIGGRRSGGHFATFDAYDVAADRWRDLPDMPTARSGLGAAFAGGLVLAVGGEGPRMFPEVEAFDVSAGTWKRLPDLAVPVHGVGVGAIGSNLYACAGGFKVGLAPTRTCQVLAIG